MLEPEKLIEIGLILTVSIFALIHDCSGGRGYKV